MQSIGLIDQNTNNAIKTWTGTKEEYDNITTKDPNTLYNVKDDIAYIANEMGYNIPFRETLYPKKGELDKDLIMKASILKAKFIYETRNELSEKEKTKTKRKKRNIKQNQKAREKMSKTVLETKDLCKTYIVD